MMQGPYFLRKSVMIGLLPFAGLLGVACDDDNDVTAGYDFQPIATQAAENVIVPTYADLDAKSQTLLDAVNALRTEPTEANLTAARDAWRAARKPWEQSEGFLYGPVSNQGLDPALDSWPVNKLDLDAVLASSDELTAEYVDQLESTLHGFHTIEYLLFGEDGDKPAASFTPRQYDYLSACTENLRSDAAALYDGWRASSGNFVLQFTDPGSETGRVYPSAKSVAEEIVVGLVAIADEVANGKINDPFSTSDLTLEESQFSDNSKADFQDNIRSIQNVYLGTYGTSASGPSLSDFVKEKNAELDTRVKAEIQAAIDAIGAIPNTFTDAVINNRPAVQAAQDAVRTLLQSLQADVQPLVQDE